MIDRDRILDERRAALEEAFFRKENERLRQKLRRERERDEARRALAAQIDIADGALLERLVDLGIRVETVDALVLAPLAMVAWADGAMEEREREAVLRGAEASGIARGTPAHRLLENWTAERPPFELLDAWQDYVGSLLAEMTSAERDALEARLVGRAREVARATGGFLGVGSVSREEDAVLDALASVFDQAKRASTRR